MSIPIKTNQLKIDVNAVALSEKYDVFKIETSDKFFSRGAYILDVPLLCNNVCSVFFDSGMRFYVLMLKSVSNKSLLKTTLLETDEGNKITLVEIKMDALDQRVLLSLLLNALGTYETDFLRFNNLTGHLYCFHPQWFCRRTRNHENVVLKIPCMELSVTNDLRLVIAVRTFTSELLKKQIVFINCRHR